MVAIYQTIITLERARPMKDDQGDDWVIPNKKTSTLIFHLYNFIIDDHLILGRLKWPIQECEREGENEVKEKKCDNKLVIMMMAVAR